MTYVGRTEHGRIVHEASLEECVDSLKFIARQPEAFLVGGVERKHYYVYPSEEVAEQNGAGWFATIEVVP